MLGSPAVPAEAIDPATISQQPADTTAIEGSTATFRVGVTTPHGLPVCYQWHRAGVDVAGAKGPAYSFTATPADDGVLFSVTVTPMGAGPVVSRDARLIISHDTSGPVLLSASVDLGTNVSVTFNEPVSLATAQNVANYLIDGTAPLTATVTNGTNVLLTMAAPLSECVRHALVTSNVEDLFSNKIVPNPTTTYFFSQLNLILVDATHLWKYEISGTDLTGTGWQAPGYADGAWPSGPAVLAWEPDNNTPAGYPIRTVLNNFTNAPFKGTTYFRTHFNVQDPSGVTRLQLREVLDDGALYYLNGSEIYSNRMPAGPYTYSTLTSAGSTEPHPLEGPSDLPLLALVPGDNVLAVEVHQSSGTSSDVVFGADLIATVSGCRPNLTISRSGSNLTITWSAPGAILEHAGAATGSWSAVSGASSPYHVTATGSPQYFRLHQP